MRCLQVAERGSSTWLLSAGLAMFKEGDWEGARIAYTLAAEMGFEVTFPKITKITGKKKEISYCHLKTFKTNVPTIRKKHEKVAQSNAAWLLSRGLHASPLSAAAHTAMEVVSWAARALSFLSPDGTPAVCGDLDQDQ